MLFNHFDSKIHFQMFTSIVLMPKPLGEDLAIWVQWKGLICQASWLSHLNYSRNSWGDDGKITYLLFSLSFFHFKIKELYYMILKASLKPVFCGRIQIAEIDVFLLSRESKKASGLNNAYSVNKVFVHYVF